jgi:Ca2+:H+ antiporter
MATGTCFLVGGCFYKQQRFNIAANRTCGTMLLLAALGVAMPTGAAVMMPDSHARDDWVLLTSRGAAVVLLAWCASGWLSDLG